MRETWQRGRALLPGSRRSAGLWLVAIVALALVILWGFNLGPAAAPSAQSAYDPAVPPVTDTQIGAWPVALDVGAKLVAVMALIYLVSALAKRYLLRTGPLSPSNLRVVETRSLGPKKSLYLIEVGGRALLLGATDSTISNLAEFTDPSVVATLTPSLDQDAKLDFPRLLAAVRGSSSAQLEKPHSAFRIPHSAFERGSQ